MKTIILHGILAKKFGKTFKLSVNSTKEAMRALCVQLTGFEAFMMNAHRQGLRFAVLTTMASRTFLMCHGIFELAVLTKNISKAFRPLKMSKVSM